MSVVALPEWLALGLAIAAGLAVVFTAVFLLGERLFPTADHSQSGRSGEWKRRQEIRSYLGSIDERYIESGSVHGNRVAFYLPERDVAITFDGTTYFRLDRTPTHPILVEHEMPGAHLGSRLPFDTPSPSHSDTGANRYRATTAFEILGVSEDATEEEITAAYRDRIKDVHPDHGGDEETFRRVREAYTIAREATK